MKYIILLSLTLFVGCAAMEGMPTAEDAYNDPGLIVLDAVKPVVDAVGPFVSPKYSAALSALMGLGLGLARARYNRNITKKIIEGIEESKDSNGIVNFDKVTSQHLNSKMGPEGRRIVDEVQGKKPSKLF